MRYSKWIHLTSRELLFNRLQFLSFSTEGWFHLSSPFLPHSFSSTLITLAIHPFHPFLHIPIHFIIVFNSIPFLRSIHPFYLHSLSYFHPSPPYHTLYSRNTHNTFYLITPSYSIHSHCGCDEPSIRAICDSISLYRTIQPSVENERNWRRLNNSSREVRWIHLEYRISYFLLYTDCIS